MASTTAEQTRIYMLVFYTGLYCIYWHDWISTLVSEYQRIWKAEWSITKVLYIVTRYSPLILSIFILQGFNVDYTETQCRKTLMPMANALPLLVQATVSGIIMIRCWAIWNHNRYILAFFLVLQAAQSATGAWLVASYIDVVSFPDGHGPCIYMITRPTMTAGCILSVLIDTAATGLLAYRAYKIRSRVAGGVKSEILSLIVRHGALYAFGLAISVIANLTFGAISMKYDTAFRGYPGSNFCTVIAASLACRLVLSLRESDEARGWSSANSGATNSSNSGNTGAASTGQTKFGVKSANSHKSGVKISTHTLQAYDSGSTNTVHLTAFPDEKDGTDSTINAGGSLEMNELESSSPKTLTEENEKKNHRDLEKGF